MCELGFCCCVCCCGDTTESCRKACGREKTTKFCYLFIVLVFTIPAILIMFLINKWDAFKTHFSWMSCPASTGGRCRPSMCINEGFFCIKYLFVLGLFIGLLFAPNSSFQTYAQISKYISIIFVVIQIIILIDLFYLAGIKLVAKYDEGNACYGVLLIVLSIIVFAIALGLNIAGYARFHSTDQCGSTLWLNIITTLILITLPLLQLCHFNKQNSLLTTALVSTYISYLAFICQYSYCSNSNSAITRVSIGSLAVDVGVSTFFFLLTMYGSIMGGSGQVKISQNNNLNSAMGVAPTKQDEQNEKKEKEKEQNRPRADSGERLEDPEADAVALSKYTDTCDWTKWHFYMCIASIYLAMLITNWNSASPTTSELVSSNFGFWIRVIMSWLTALLYVWTLVAPRCFPERDFTVT